MKIYIPKRVRQSVFCVCTAGTKEEIKKIREIILDNANSFLRYTIFHYGSNTSCHKALWPFTSFVQIRVLSQCFRKVS